MHRWGGFNEELLMLLVTMLQYGLFSSKVAFAGCGLAFWFVLLFFCNYWNLYYLSSNNYFRRCWETIRRTSFLGLGEAEGAQLFLESMTVCFQFHKNIFVLLKFGLIYCCCVIHNIVAFGTFGVNKVSLLAGVFDCKTIMQQFYT